jgi:hypothetical protein
VSPGQKSQGFGERILTSDTLALYLSQSSLNVVKYFINFRTEYVRMYPCSDICNWVDCTEFEGCKPTTLQRNNTALCYRASL